MMSEKCPKCGAASAGTILYPTLLECGSIYQTIDPSELAFESETCLRNQLAAMTKERDELREACNGVLGWIEFCYGDSINSPVWRIHKERACAAIIKAKKVTP